MYPVPKSYITMNTIVGEMYSKKLFVIARCVEVLRWKKNGNMTTGGIDVGCKIISFLFAEFYTIVLVLYILLEINSCNSLGK